MKTLLIDAGNSHLKWATLAGKNLSKQQNRSYKEKPPAKLFEAVVESNHAEIDSILMVSVLGKKFLNEVHKIAVKHKVKITNIESISQLAGIKNGYNKPHKLGADRLVAMVAAFKISNTNTEQTQACIIIDSGTATTIDAVDANGQHLGGVIMPGLNLCAESLLENTELISLWNNDKDEFVANFFSRDTSQAIANGCVLGLAGGIDSICNKMESTLIKQAKEKGITINKIICGGSSRKILPHLQNDYNYNENLLMIGLQIIKEDSLSNV
jgi:type III pantothenate kinase